MTKAPRRATSVHQRGGHPIGVPWRCLRQQNRRSGKSCGAWANGPSDQEDRENARQWKRGGGEFSTKLLVLSWVLLVGGVVWHVHQWDPTTPFITGPLIDRVFLYSLILGMWGSFCRMVGHHRREKPVEAVEPPTGARMVDWSRPSTSRSRSGSTQGCL